MKKLMCLLLALVCLCAFFGCAEEEIDENYEDLTKFSGTMVQTRLENMRNYPHLFAGKTVKMEGLIVTDESGETYYCGYIDDTACCYRYLELSWVDENVAISQLPDTSRAVIEGVFDGACEDILTTEVCGRLTGVTIVVE